MVASSSRAFTASKPNGGTAVVTTKDLKMAGVNTRAKSADALSPKDRRKLSKTMQERRGTSVNLATQKTTSKADRQKAAAQAGMGRKKDLLSNEQKATLTRANQIKSSAKATGDKDMAKKATSKIAGLNRSATSKESTRSSGSGSRLSTGFTGNSFNESRARNR